MRLRNQTLAELNYFRDCAWLCEHPRMSCNSYHPAQYLRCHPISGFPIENLNQPAPAKSVVTGICTERVHKHVYVGQDHSSRIWSSRSLDRLRSIPGRIPPEAVETGNRTGSRRGVRASARTAFSPSSMRDVNVRPSAMAFFFARRSKSGDRRTVVLIFQTICW